MEKRYQVFISSTYADLQDERQEVMQALLELDCIPAGMELFPAASDDQWTLIKKVIDDCDYYMVIVAGRYGSISPDGMSYTEMEYRYAMETSKPIIGFVHRTPGNLAANRCESTDEGKANLALFRELVQKKMCRFWDSPTDLGSQVSRSLVKLIKSNPGIGWVRGNFVPSESAMEEILTLRRKVEDLQSKLKAAQTSAPEGTFGLAQGTDPFEIHFSFVASSSQSVYKRSEYVSTVIVEWNDIFAAVSPLMIDEATERQLENALNKLVIDRASLSLQKSEQFKAWDIAKFQIDSNNFQTIKIQLRALGLIAKSTKGRSIKDTSTYWTLTPYGDNIMTKLRAITKSNTSEKSSIL